MKSDIKMGNFPQSIISKNYNTPIYRCIHFERLLEMLSLKNIVLVRTKMWEDPYENFLFKTKIRFGSHYTSLGSFTDSLYGQCWTMKKETDAIWRIYSPTKQSVIIKTKISKLAKAVFDSETLLKDRFDTWRKAIAPVAYFSKNKMQNVIHQYSCLALPDAKIAFDSLFIKRNEFSHEHEVRVIIQKRGQTEDDFNKDGERKFVKLPIDPNDFIEEILLDPRINESQKDLYSNIFRSAGYNGKINKSTLYDTF
ncbi:DUF2971 domain-containing protein [Chryseobacterium balustinum]|uniref:DUF2971 domain-containing protein n=1 Tax=Chryseobacterium balustinum TaxID=246 RepID=A0AAX2IMZ2_9FLAO|nr:hypothetical protein [Chryseobacterium balustinum]AZB30291.1 hypothetical protein EB354_14075 [Chryseobacterium balustinum]SKC03191.1 hypothetical protein SAMN05421800_12230 [Chryseobacterium balustinum]SQA90927.1 Uncharacterised protein [Chryseobacterium balustinum]